MGSNDYTLGIVEQEDLGERREEVEHDSVRSDDDSSAAMDDFLRSRINNMLVDDTDSASFSQEMGPEDDFPEDKQVSRFQQESSIIREESPPHEHRNKLTEPRTPVREDSSSSSSSSFAHSQLTPLYNPFSHYTPTRPARKEVMGMSIFNYPSSDPTIRKPYQFGQFNSLESDRDSQDKGLAFRRELDLIKGTRIHTIVRESCRTGRPRLPAKSNHLSPHVLTISALTPLRCVPQPWAKLFVMEGSFPGPRVCPGDTCR